MNKKIHTQNLIRNYTHRLMLLKEQKALEGLFANPNLLLDIDETETQLAQLQKNSIMDASNNTPTNTSPLYLVFNTIKINFIKKSTESDHFSNKVGL